MKLVIFSDDHGRLDPLTQIVNMHKDAYAFIHLGDSQGMIDRLRELYPNHYFVAVRGNCDRDFTLPTEEVLLYGGKKIFCCHGHLHGVKGGLEHLKLLAKKEGYDIVLFGHSHKRTEHYKDGIYYFNPGSCGEPRDGQGKSFGIVEIRDNGVLLSHGNIQ